MGHSRNETAASTTHYGEINWKNEWQNKDTDKYDRPGGVIQTEKPWLFSRAEIADEYAVCSANPTIHFARQLTGSAGRGRPKDSAGGYDT